MEQPPQVSDRDYSKLRKSYCNYVEFYKILNNGSLAGVSSFSDYYLHRNYINRYSDIRVFVNHIMR